MAIAWYQILFILGSKNCPSLVSSQIEHVVTYSEETALEIATKAIQDKYGKSFTVFSHKITEVPFDFIAKSYHAIQAERNKEFHRNTEFSDEN